MNTLSTKKLANIVLIHREENFLSQEDLSNLTGINKIIIDRIEHEDFMPSIVQLKTLAKVLEFDPMHIFIEKNNTTNNFNLLHSQTLTDIEKEGLDKLFQMMLTLRQQITLRNLFENGIDV